ncbi:MAG: UDP-N-acetylmuramoyl-L-alanine--D-glutamate ligase [Acidobacteriaceae bacterium]|nr:UDP-N-acetylmuramoyl-L-alanine--D-glutamate ligase [Acidobacteriaceae bacterium]
MNFTRKSVVVIGAKRSGLAGAELLVKQGARVRVMDSEVLPAEEQARFDALGVPVVKQSPENLTADVIVISPGVPYDLPMLADARRRGVPVIGEVEMAAYFLKGPIIGITGSNGKTTTTALTGHLLRECGIASQVGGNIGRAVTSLIGSSTPEQWNVLELSSFQLESIEQFRARIAGCLNVTPDHLDRHHTFENYAAAKRRLFETQKKGDFAVLNYEDETCREFALHTAAQVFWFSSSQSVPRGVSADREEMCFAGQPFMKRRQIRLRGIHNLENVMAAALMAHLAGAKLADLGPAVESFPGVEHRIEFVRTLDGVDYFNDSKATNVDAVLKAVEAFPGNLWIILGGKDKGSDYVPLREPLRQKAKAALLIGAAAPLIAQALDSAVPLVESGDVTGAVRYARSHASAGDVVLLAPACASFDQFKNFEERGLHFKQVVAELF